MKRFTNHPAVLILLVIATIGHQACGNVLMTTDQTTASTERISDAYDDELFDPSKQSPDIIGFRDAERELELDAINETAHTTTIDDIFDTIQSSANATLTTAEPTETAELSNQPHDDSIVDQTYGAVTISPAVDTITSPTSTDFKSTVPSEVATTLQSSTAAPTPTAMRRLKKIQTTPAPPPLKQNANEILRRLLDDQYIRTPMAALIDTSGDALRKSKMLWKAAVRPQAPLDIVLVAYNSTGIGVTYTFKNTRTMIAGLESIHESQPERGTAFFGIMRASELIPYDSAIFVCTDAVSLDENLGQYAALTLLKKRIRLYLIWFGAATSTTDINDANGNTSVDGGMLGEVALKSGGEIIRVTEDTSDIAAGGSGLITLYWRKHLLDANEVEIPEAAEVVDDILRNDETNRTTSSNAINSIDGEYFGPKYRKTRSDDTEGEFDRDADAVPDEVYAGTNFLRDNSMEENNLTDVVEILGRNTLQAVTSIQMGIQSQLLANPGSTVQLYFEVTNLREEATFHNFQVADEKRYLQTLSPLSAWLTAGQTTTAVVTAFIPPNTEIGTSDKITFTSQGLGLASQAATLTVTGNGAVLDSRIPTLNWAYGSRCDYKTGPGQCASAVWSLEVTTQDLDTGILRIQSKPAGLTIRNAFVVGTNNEVKATYTSSCCVTRVTITAVDVAGNQRTVTLDVTEFLLNEASIAAISLGVVLILVILLVAILLCVWCSRKRRESRDLELFRARSAGQPASGQ